MITRSLSRDAAAGFDLDLSQVFGNRAGSIAVLGSSARESTWHTVLGSLLDRGDRVLSSRHGADSARLVGLAEQVGLDVVSCDVPPGRGVPLSWFSHLLWIDPSIKAVLVTQEESTSGVRNDIAQIRRVLDQTGSAARLLVDTTPLGALGFRQDEWAVDAVVCGPSLADTCSVTVLSAGARTGAELAAGTDLTWSDTVGIEALDGVDAWRTELPPDLARRHSRWLAEGVRRGLSSLGMTLCAQAPQSRSDSVSVYSLPPGADRSLIATSAVDASVGAALNGGSRGLAPDQVRFDHRWLRTEKSCLAVVAAMERALIPCTGHAGAGAGMTATFSWFMDTSPTAAP